MPTGKGRAEAAGHLVERVAADLPLAAGGQREVAVRVLLGAAKRVEDRAQRHARVDLRREPDADGDAELLRENERLRKENRILREEREVLKKAAMFFAAQKP